MKLEYKILWIEDDRDWLIPKKEEIGEYLEDFGFTLDVKENSRGSIDNNLDFNDFDIVAVDYNLENGQTGDTFIKELREKAPYTEILFYSVDGPIVLRSRIAEQKCDGVYCSDRRDVIEAMKNLIYITIKKTQDINNIRGLIIAETTDIENKLRDMAIGIHKNSTPEEAIKKIEEVIKGFVGAYNNDIAKMKKVTSITKLLEKNGKHHHYTKEICAKLRNDDPILHLQRIEKLEKIKEEIIELRNMMAHAREEKGVLVNHNNGKRTIIKIDENKCNEYRKTIREHRMNLEEIRLIIDMDASDSMASPSLVNEEGPGKLAETIDREEEMSTHRALR